MSRATRAAARGTVDCSVMAAKAAASNLARSIPAPPYNNHHNNHKESKMTDTNKPAWVAALDEAKTMLGAAATATTPEETDSKTRLAYGWMDLAKLYKSDTVPAGRQRTDRPA